MLFGCGEGRPNKITDYFRFTKRLVSSKPSTGQERALRDLSVSERGRPRPPPCVPNSATRPQDRRSATSSQDTATAVPAPRDGSVAPSRRSRASRSRSNGRASSAISLINRIRKDEYKQTRDSSVERRTLDISDFDHLLERIRKNPDRDLPEYFDRRLKYVQVLKGRTSMMRKLMFHRYEYLAFTNLFVIHMSPTPVHSGLASSVCSEIRSQLRNHNFDRGTEREREKLKEKSREIRSLGDGRVKFKDRPDERSPDGSFRHRNCEYPQPGLTVEVNWSHYRTTEEFEEKAQNLIELGNGVIRTVVNIDLGQIYRAGLRDGVKTGGAAPATLSVWRANSTTPTDATVTARRDVHSQVMPTNARPKLETNSLKTTRFFGTRMGRQCNRRHCGCPLVISCVKGVTGARLFGHSKDLGMR